MECRCGSYLLIFERIADFPGLMLLAWQQLVCRLAGRLGARNYCTVCQGDVASCRSRAAPEYAVAWWYIDTAATVDGSSRILHWAFDVRALACSVACVLQNGCHQSPT